MNVPVPEFMQQFHTKPANDNLTWWRRHIRKRWREEKRAYRERKRQRERPPTTGKEPEVQPVPPQAQDAI